MAVGAPHHATCDLVSQTAQADLAASELHDGAGLGTDVVEVQHADVQLATVDAAGHGQRRKREANVPFLRLRSPTNGRQLGLGPSPSSPSGRPAAVAVRAHDLASRHLQLQDRQADPSPHERRDLGTLGAQVVELEDHRIRLAAVHARARPEMVEDERLSLADARRLEGVAPATVVSTLLGVVALEAVTAPPLETVWVAVEGAHAAQARAP